MLKESADGTTISTAEAGGFVGVYFGMYAYAEGKWSLKAAFNKYIFMNE